MILFNKLIKKVERRLFFEIKCSFWDKTNTLDLNEIYCHFFIYTLLKYHIHIYIIQKCCHAFRNFQIITKIINIKCLLDKQILNTTMIFIKRVNYMRIMMIHAINSQNESRGYMQVKIAYELQCTQKIKI